ncbi:hypothetical protein M9Y10_019873 [Tritrichomonas musculus]|uniref:Uncharacterized protein n=1 Tax=Tritrichomonas musculus TaxID=1915356 RepID=A0ABR2HHM2_9EUKA
MDFIKLLFKENNNNEFCHLYSFVEYIRDYDEVKRSNTLTINTITLGTQQTKTIRQRMTFQISNNQNEFIVGGKNCVLRTKLCFLDEYSIFFNKSYI